MKRAFHIIVYLFAFVGFVLIAGYVSVRLGWTNTPGIIDRQTAAFLRGASDTASTSAATWAYGPEWDTFAQAVLRDRADLDRAATLAGVPARLIVAPLLAEQMRLFYSEREIFKKIFEPLKILGNQSQFSWGVMGIKQDTAIAVEEHLTDASSPYYLGPDYAHLLDFTTSDHDQERFQRIIDDKSRFFSYLYAGLYMKEVEAQWRKAGFDISNRPDILCTLFNIGFDHSRPHADPQVGGSEIDIGGRAYSFGGLCGEFYGSSELIDEFPR